MSRLHPVFNVVKLTPVPLNPIKGCCPHPPPLPEMIDGKEEWIVKEILDSKMMNRKSCYLVKWEEFRVEHNSWEPWDNIHALEHVAATSKNQLAKTFLTVKGPMSATQPWVMEQPPFRHVLLEKGGQSSNEIERPHCKRGGCRTCRMHKFPHNRGSWHSKQKFSLSERWLQQWRNTYTLYQCCGYWYELNGYFPFP